MVEERLIGNLLPVPNILGSTAECNVWVYVFLFRCLGYRPKMLVDMGTNSVIYR